MISMAEAAEIAHGKSYFFSQVSQLPADLPPANPIALRQLSSIKLVNHHVVLSLLCTLLALEWLLRRRSGML